MKRDDGLSIDTVPYAGWKNCWKLSNGTVDLVVTAEVGPRIIRFGFTGAENEFHEFPDQIGKTGGSEWRNYGGHRLWHAPEINPRTYAPDNDPIRLERRDDWAVFVPPQEESTGIQKEMHVRLLPGANGEGRVEVRHILTNAGPWGVTLAPWAISVMAPGGTAIIPLPPRGPQPVNLQPTSSMTLWAYTDMSDPRWTWLQTCVLLRQDAKAADPQKIGMSVEDGWAAYARGNHLFVKGFQYMHGSPYLDRGANVETFTNADMLELETLGPAACLEQGQSVEHTEFWTLWPDVPTPKTQADIQRNILPRVKV